MRFAYTFAVLGIVLSAASTMAQEVKPADPPASGGEWTGPVVGGRHRQPTQAEIDARRRVKGDSTKAIEEQDRKENKEIDDLYNELIKPPPPLNEENGK